MTETEAAGISPGRTAVLVPWSDVRPNDRVLIGGQPAICRRVLVEEDLAAASGQVALVSLSYEDGNGRMWDTERRGEELAAVIRQDDSLGLLAAINALRAERDAAREQALALSEAASVPGSSHERPDGPRRQPARTPEGTRR